MSRHDGPDDNQRTLAAYLREVGELPRLSLEEEAALGRRIQRNRDEAAISRLVESNLRFVVRCAKRYRWVAVSLLDLIHEGNLGLVEAARRFDPAKNITFRTHAAWWVRESMMHLLTDRASASSSPAQPCASGSAIQSGRWTGHAPSTGGLRAQAIGSWLPHRHVRTVESRHTEDLLHSARDQKWLELTMGLAAQATLPALRAFDPRALPVVG